MWFDLALIAVGGNPNSQSNAEVVFPWRNGEAVTSRDPDKWIINFGERSVTESALFEAPFRHVNELVKPARHASGSPSEKSKWWLLARRAPALFRRLAEVKRFIVTPETPTHTVFAWCEHGVMPDKNLVVICRERIWLSRPSTKRECRCASSGARC